MPTYEYECQSCHERIEAVQKFTEPSLTTCPLCGGELRKVFSAVGIVFKGSGFYKNDSRSKSSSTTSSNTTNPSTPSTPESPATPTSIPTPSTPSTPASSTSSSGSSNAGSANGATASNG
jgi:putative FmdB family regulatory protein